MAREVWGTYAVNDHCLPRAFLADVMLYDRLVIPIPVSEDRQEWEEKNWQPELQEKILKILGERAYAIPWTHERRAEWKDHYEQGSQLANDLGDWAFMATRSILTEHLPRHITGIEAVPTYTSLEKLENDLDIEEQDPAVELWGGTVAAIVGHEFLVPDDPDASYEDLLKQAVDYSARPVFRRKRSSFWRWHREFLNDKGITDQLAIKAAVNEMSELIKEEQSVIKRTKLKTSLQYAFMIGSVSLGMLGGPLTPFAVGGAFVSVGQFIADRLLKQDDQEPKPAALLHDVRKHFGWK